MYSDHVRVGFYWGGRGEKVQACAHRAAEFLSGLGQRLDTLGAWFDLSERPEHRKPARVTVSAAGLERVLSAGTTRNDLGELIPTLGFTLSLGNRTKDDFVHLKLICGGSSQWVQNICVLRIPRGTTEYEKMLRPPLAVDLARWIVQCWEPDRGVVTSLELDGQIPFDEDQTEAGWVTYLSARAYPEPFNFQGSVHVEPVASLGCLLVIPAESYSPSDPEQARIAKKVFDIINYNI